MVYKAYTVRIHECKDVMIFCKSAIYRQYRMHKTCEFNLLLADFLKALLKEKKHVVQKNRNVYTLYMVEIFFLLIIRLP